MLTDADRKWLIARQQNVEVSGWYSCTSGKLQHLVDFHREHLHSDWQDCAEFEARVAALLTVEAAPWSPCYHTGHCPLHVETVVNCMACRLKHARLAVEEEMDR